MCLGDAKQITFAKTAKGILDWRPEKCLGQLSLPGCEVDLGIEDLTISIAASKGAKTLILGVAPLGGELPQSWHAMLFEALESGLDIANGLHDKLENIPNLVETANRLGRILTDVRYSKDTYPIATGKKRQGMRLLTVGTDCAVGKMYTTLAIEKAMKVRGMDADFRATGQTGILITGSGIPIDAVICDFTSGAAETVSPCATSDKHWDIIEGQGSLFHPSYAGVTLGLIHGSQPDALVLCHEVGREQVIGVKGYSTPSFAQCFKTYLNAAKLTNPNAKFIGISVNTSSLSEKQAFSYLNEIASGTGLPCVDPVRTGVKAIVDVLEKL